MARTGFWFLIMALVVGGLAPGDAAAEPALGSASDIRALYERLQPGMSAAAQERLTSEEQHAWAHALELPRSAEDEMARMGRQP